MNSTTESSEKLPQNTLSLYQAFSQVEDPRAKRGVRYPLAVFLTVITLAKLCGQTELRGIAQWAQYRAASLCAAFELKRETMPHWTSYSRVLSRVDVEAVQAAVLAGLPSEEPESPQLSMDGKTLRGTIPQGQTQGAHLLAVYDPDQRQVVAQVRVAAKTNELGAAPQALNQVSLQDRLVTGDAMFTHAPLSQSILDAGGDYLWVVKDNQPHLCQMLDRLFRPEQPRPGHGCPTTDFQTVTQVNKGHGRVERRTLTTSQMLSGYCDWPGLQQVFRLERTRQSKHTPVTTQVVFGITSLAPDTASPADLLAFVRRHWAIENQLHYVRDVTLGEDACRLALPRAQHVMAILNSLVVALLPRTPFAWLPDAQRFFEAHLPDALALLL